MGMQLTIKSDEAYALASRLVELTGQSLTVAVTEALRQRLAAKEKARGKEAWIKEVQAVAADIRAELTTDGKPIDLTANFFIMKRRVCLFDHRQLAIMAVVMNEPDATTILSAMSNTTPAGRYPQERGSRPALSLTKEIFLSPPPDLRTCSSYSL